MEKIKIGEKLRQLRKENHLTQKEFGKMLGFANKTISDWEINKNEPDLSTIRKIKQIFNISYEELLDD